MREGAKVLLILFLLLLLTFSAGFNGCEKEGEKQEKVKVESSAEEKEEAAQEIQSNLPSGKVLVHSYIDDSFNLLVFSPSREETPEIGEPFISGPLALLYKQKKFKINYSITKLAEGSWLGCLNGSADKLYFFRESEIWLKDINSGNETKLVSLDKNAWIASSIFLSPSEKKMAFAFRGSAEAKPKLSILNLDSRQIKSYPISFREGSGIFWLDEKNIIFLKNEKTIVRYNLITLVSEEIVRSPNIIWSFTVSPDRKKILYYTEEDQASLFYLASVSGGESQLVYKIEGYRGRPGESFSWLPDNKTVAMELGGEDVGRFNIMLLDVEKGEIVKELRSRATTAGPSPKAPEPVRAQIDFLHPVVSPDGKWLLCTRAENIDWGNPPGNQNEKWVLVLYSLDDLTSEYKIWDGGNQAVTPKEWKE